MVENPEQQWARHKAWVDSLKEEDRAVLRYIQQYDISDIFRVYRVASMIRSRGGPTRINDVLWSIFNEDSQEFFRTMQMGLLRNVFFSMGELLSNEGRHEAALERYLCAAFFDANGCRNVDPIAFRKFPDVIGLPFQPKSAPKKPFPGLVGRIAQAVNSGGSDFNKARQIMIDICSSSFRGYDRIGMNVQAPDAWQWLERDLADAIASGIKRRGPRKPPPTIPPNLDLPKYPKAD